MNAQSMLDQLFKSGMSLLNGKGAAGAAGSLGSLGAMGSAGASKLLQNWGQFGAGAASGGALGLLLGSKRGRSIGGKVLQYGSVAALGVMAFKAFSSWQQKQAESGAIAQPQRASGFPAQGSLQPSSAPLTHQSLPLAAPLDFTAVAAGPVRTVDLLPAPEAEVHSVAMLLAMIAAAKSDGHIDDRERGLVEAELNRLEADPTMRRWFEDQLRRPLDPAEVARAASSPELAGEMYLVSLLMTDQTSFMERAYLDELARQLRLPDGLKLELEAQASAA